MSKRTRKRKKISHAANVAGEKNGGKLSVSIASNSTPKLPIGQDLNDTLIYCEWCAALERVSLDEAEKRGTPCLCWECYYRPIQTEMGTAIHWALCDALFTLVWELQDAGVGHKADLHAALRRAYRKMSRAKYLTADDLAAMEATL